MSLSVMKGQVGLKPIDPEFIRSSLIKEIKEYRVDPDSEDRILTAEYFFDENGKLTKKKEIKGRDKEPKIITYEYDTLENREIFITKESGQSMKIVNFVDPWGTKILKEVSVNDNMMLTDKEIKIDTINKVTIATEYENNELKSQYIRKYGISTDTFIQRFYEGESLDNELVSINYYSEGNLIMTLFEKEPANSHYKFYYIYDGSNRQIGKFWIHRNGEGYMEDQFVYDENGSLKDEIRLSNNKQLNRYKHSLNEDGLRNSTEQFLGESKVGEYVYIYQFY